MKDTITCGFCYTKFDPFIYTDVFSDCALQLATCPNCEHDILISTVHNSKYYQVALNQEYFGLAKQMVNALLFINDLSNSREGRGLNAIILQTALNNCANDPKTTEYTKMYTAHPDSNSLFKYEPKYVAKFVFAFFKDFKFDADIKSMNYLTSLDWIEKNFLSLAISRELLKDLDSSKPPEVDAQFMLIKDNLKFLSGDVPFGVEVDDYMKNMRSQTNINKEIQEENLKIIEVAKRMYHNYTARQTNLINLFQVTDNIMPTDPTSEETAAREFFRNNPQDQIVLPGPEDMHIFKSDLPKFMSILAQDSSQPIRIHAGSKLTFKLFLSQVSQELEKHSNNPILSKTTLLSSNSERSITGFRTVSYIRKNQSKIFEENPTILEGDNRLQPKNNVYENGKFEGVIVFQLGEPSIDDLKYLLKKFTPKIEATYNVSFKPESIEEIALSSQKIYPSLAIIDRAIRWLDEIAANKTYKTGSLIKQDISIQDVQDFLFNKYQSFSPTKHFDTDLVKGLEERLNQHVIAQPRATKAVAEALIRASFGLNNPNRPLATMLFVGPTGVGKTELAKQLALELLGSENEYIRFDMSEYSSYESGLIKLIGVSAQYLKSENEGELIEAVRDHPSAIILFDEFEKSSSSVQNLMLQVLDEGHITSGRGITYSMKSNILIFTSNAGVQMADSSIGGFGGKDEKAKYVLSKVKLQSTFPPELQNRFSHIIEFDSLEKESLFKILELKLKRYYTHFRNQNITIQISDEVKAELVNLGNDPDFGARPLERAIDNYLITPITNTLINETNITKISVNLDSDKNIIATKVDEKDETLSNNPTGSILYVDGAFNPTTSISGFAGLLVINDKKSEFSGSIDDKNRVNLRDFGGEMEAAIQGLQQAIDSGVKEITLVYDFKGIEAWATDAWSAKTVETKKYQRQIKTLMSKIKVTFLHIKSQTNDENKRVNELAKISAGLEIVK